MVREVIVVGAVDGRVLDVLLLEVVVLAHSEAQEHLGEHVLG